MRSAFDNSLLDLMYKGTTTIQDFCWDNLITTPILYLMSANDINYIRKLITSPRYSGNNKLKTEKIDELMHFRGFTKFAGGTNRIVYTHPSAPNTVFKVAIDSVGINDNPAEYRNQQFLKPYCCKVFECSPCGTIASFERVDRITTFEEFYSIADDYFYLLSRVVLGKYVMEDIGIDYFMNVGIRRGFGVVILDFPYLFELDGAKLECSSVLDDGTICKGEIDYDHGFNKLVCGKCGRVYRARDLAKPPENGGAIVYKKGGRRMKIVISRGNDIIKEVDTCMEREYLSKPENPKSAKRDRNSKIKIELTGGTAEAKRAAHEEPDTISSDRVVKENVHNVIKPLAISEKKLNHYVNTEVSNSGIKVECGYGEPIIETVDIADMKPAISNPIEENCIDNSTNETVEETQNLLEEISDDNDHVEEIESSDNHEYEECELENNSYDIPLDDGSQQIQQEEIVDSDSTETESSGEDESGLDDIVIVDSLPNEDDASMNVAYLLKIDDSIDTDDIDADDFDSLEMVPPTLFAIYLKGVDGKLARYTCTKDGGLEFYDEEHTEEDSMIKIDPKEISDTVEKKDDTSITPITDVDEDAIIEKLKASVKKTSLEDLE